MNASAPVFGDDDLTREAMRFGADAGLFAAERYHFHACLDSTNREAMALARAGASEGTVVVADAQTGGRGRLGRRWESPAGENLYVSVVLRPEMPVCEASRLTLMAGVAVVEAVREAGVSGACLKWPNDLLVEGRKLAGILTEMSVEGERMRHVVVGIGVNVNGRAADFSPEVAARAVTMADILHRPCGRAFLLSALLAGLERWYHRLRVEGFEPVLQAWKSRAVPAGQRVRIETSGSVCEGWLEDLDAQGFLLVRDLHGRQQRVLAGDVTLV
ncbi:MAG: biotin--[acetyl-CoA-carboxylase] ligase [Magnetococcales bacterium]|nr:biotin--[acetyl-CoA-carboxylase] ligase [Magnetococcales bacterium]